MLTPSPIALVVGSLTKDEIVCGRTRTWQIGGVAWHAATALAALGIRTRVVTRTAASDSEITDALRAAGIEVLNRPCARTTVFVNEYAEHDADQMLGQWVPALAHPIGARQLASALSDVGRTEPALAYMGPLHPADLSDAAWNALQRQRPSVVALDVQGYTRVLRQGRVQQEPHARLPSLLKLCDVVKANRAEAQAATGSPDPQAAAAQLAQARPGLEVLVTCGPDGATVAHGSHIHSCPAVPVTVADSTGAGDIFFASYLARRLAGDTPDKAAHFAATHTARRLSDPKRLVRLSP